MFICRFLNVYTFKIRFNAQFNQKILSQAKEYNKFQTSTTIRLRKSAKRLHNGNLETYLEIIVEYVF